MTLRGLFQKLTALMAAATVSSEIASAQSCNVSKEEMLYRNIPGNEFRMRFTSMAAPEGRMVTIDPDDMMVMCHPTKGHKVLTPRFRFMTRINEQMPNVPGMEMSANEVAQKMREDSGITVDGNSVASMFKHLVTDHKIPLQQIEEAMRQVHARRNVPIIR